MLLYIIFLSIYNNKHGYTRSPFSSKHKLFLTVKKITIVVILFFTWEVSVAGIATISCRALPAALPELDSLTASTICWRPECSPAVTARNAARCPATGSTAVPSAWVA